MITKKIIFDLLKNSPGAKMDNLCQHYMYNYDNLTQEQIKKLFSILYKEKQELLKCDLKTLINSF